MKRTYRYNTETKEMEEITREPIEWRIGGERYGSETLAEMKRKNLVPPSDFKDTWAKAEIERKRLRGELPETTQMKEARRRDVMDAMAKVRAGYKPRRRG